MIPNPIRVHTSIVAILASVGTASCASNPAPRTTPAKVAAVPHPAPTPVPAPAPGAFNPRVPLTPAQAKWVDCMLATLSLRERVGQMVMVWVLGDYTSNGDSSFAEVRRWIERDGIGGVSMSLGTPIEVAAKINAMHRAARVPLLVSADLEPGLGRLEG